MAKQEDDEGAFWHIVTDYTGFGGGPYVYKTAVTEAYNGVPTLDNNYAKRGAQHWNMNSIYSKSRLC